MLLAKHSAMDLAVSASGDFTSGKNGSIVGTLGGVLLLSIVSNMFLASVRSSSVICSTGVVSSRRIGSPRTRMSRMLTSTVLWSRMTWLSRR